jgi:hypothetical protein
VADQKQFVTQDVYSVLVLRGNGKRVNQKVSITEGYSTKDDISKIVAIADPGATVEAFVLVSTTLVPSMR